MLVDFKISYKNLWYRIRSICILVPFLINYLIPISYGQIVSQSTLRLPVPGTMVQVSPAYTPTILKGMTIHEANPLEFDFIVDSGSDNLTGESLKEESKKVIKYFLAALTVPEEELWVNLSPYEQDRVITKKFGDTEMGRDLLAQDYVLKQLMASLMYPEDELGHDFWERVYEAAYAKYGTNNVDVDTFNKVWIVPEDATVYEHESSAFVIKSRLKVLLEEDYLALEKGVSAQDQEIRGGEQKRKQDHPDSDGLALGSEKNKIATKIIREILIPQIEKEVNEGKNFAQLRQIYRSMILASWYKVSLKQSLLGQVYVDQGKTKGVDTQDKQVNKKIYDQYIDAFKKGVYDYIKEDYDPISEQLIPRRYFSGGVEAMKVKKLMESQLLTQESGQSSENIVFVVNGLRKNAGNDHSVKIIVNPYGENRGVKTYFEELGNQIDDVSGSQWDSAGVSVVEMAENFMSSNNNREQPAQIRVSAPLETASSFLNVDTADHFMDNLKSFKGEVENLSRELGWFFSVNNSLNLFPDFNTHDYVIWTPNHELKSGVYAVRGRNLLKVVKDQEVRSIIQYFQFKGYTILPDFSASTYSVDSKDTDKYLVTYMDFSREHKTISNGRDLKKVNLQYLKEWYAGYNEEGLVEFDQDLEAASRRLSWRQADVNEGADNSYLIHTPNHEFKGEKFRVKHSVILKTLKNENILSMIQDLQYRGYSIIPMENNEFIAAYPSPDGQVDKNYSPISLTELSEIHAHVTKRIKTVNSMKDDFISMTGLDSLSTSDGFMKVNTSASALNDLPILYDQENGYANKTDLIGSTRQTPKNVGGINLNPALMNLQIKRNGKGIPLPMHLQNMQELLNIKGFVPVIINIQPIQSLPMLLGFDVPEGDFETENPYQSAEQYDDMLSYKFWSRIDQILPTRSLS